MRIAGSIRGSGTAGRLTLESQSVVVTASGKVNLDGNGYASDKRHESCHAGGSYEGGFHGGGPAGKACGDYEWPVLVGAGGNQYSSYSNGGTGGGSLLILCNHTHDSEVVIDGTVSVAGTAGGRSSYYGGGGGAGGSMLVVASRLSGSGTLSADGGGGAAGSASSNTGYSGSGGRIALHITQTRRAAFAGSVRARAGQPSSTSPTRIGPPGTVFWCDLPGSRADADPETNRHGCATRRLEVDNGDLVTPSGYHGQILATAPGRTRFEIDQLHLGQGIPFSLSPLDSFHAVSMPDARALLTLGNITTTPGAGLPTVHVQGGTTVTIAGLADGVVQTGHLLSHVQPNDVDGGGLTTQTRSTVMRPLEVSVASVRVHEHGRVVVPPTVVVRGASLTVDGEVVGLHSLLLDRGSVTTLSQTGGVWVNDTSLGAAGHAWAPWACEEGLVPACASRGDVRSSGDARGRYGMARLRMVGDARLDLTEGVTAIGAAELWVDDSATMSLPAGQTSQFRLQARDSLRVSASATVTGDGKGYTSDKRHESCHAGGSYEGGFHGGGPAGKACGDYEWPVLVGAGGNQYSSYSNGGTGGGSLLILCNHTHDSEVVIDGTVSVAGTAGGRSSYYGGGGGAGGSMLVVASRLSGSGTLSADGGGGVAGTTSGNTGYSGSGGRLAICEPPSSGSAQIGTGLRADENLDAVVLIRNGKASIRQSVDSTKVPTTQLRIKAIQGDNSGSLHIHSATSVVVLGLESGWAPDRETTLIRYDDAGERTLFKLQRVLAAEAELFFADLDVGVGGQLFLPRVVSVCNISVSVKGQVYGADTMKVCANDRTSASISVTGCKSPDAINFNPAALHADNSTCIFADGVRGCTLPTASNFDPLATSNDGSCEFPADIQPGCPYPAATNFVSASVDDGSCEFPDFAGLQRLYTRLEGEAAILRVASAERTALSARVDELGVQLEASRAAAATLRLFCGDDQYDAIAELGQVQANLTGWVQRYNQAAAASSTCQTSLASERAALQSSASKLADAQAATQVQASRADAAEATAANLQTRLTAAQSDLATAASELNSAQSDLASSQALVADRQRTIASLTSEAATLRTELASLRDQVAAAQANLSSEASRADQAESSMASLQDEVAVLKSQVNVSADRLALAEAKATEEEELAREVSSRLAAAEQDLAAASANLSNTRSTLAAAQGELSEARAALDRTAQLANATSVQLDAANALAAARQVQVERLKNTSLALEATLNATKQLLDQQGSNCAPAALDSPVDPCPIGGDMNCSDLTAAGGDCMLNSECASGICSFGACAAPTCSDGIRQGSPGMDHFESDTDCGGTCGGVCGSESLPGQRRLLQRARVFPGSVPSEPV
ncbi:hypothetical protein FNF31_05068 [Cafeteria roenbergensis]|uniref:Uncharacterized protein n=1 Tax=Cafeteria roenbergensis TaxID=33653 RepID=A0A5A8D196_CAFRO|nr:hypothetical protein FNF31_05068 [Cafeteria roenbergensis]